MVSSCLCHFTLHCRVCTMLGLNWVKCLSQRYYQLHTVLLNGAEWCIHGCVCINSGPQLRRSRWAFASKHVLRKHACPLSKGPTLPIVNQTGSGRLHVIAYLVITTVLFLFVLYHMKMNKLWPRSACLCESAWGVFEKGSCYYGLPFIMVAITIRRRVDNIDGDCNHCIAPK